MQRHHRPALRRLALLGVAASMLLGACSSSDGGGDDAPSPAELQRRNRAFLIERANFDEEQADCVSRNVTEDLRTLLSKGSGDSDLTKKAGYEEFAAAVRTCVRQDESITTTTGG